MATDFFYNCKTLILKHWCARLSLQRVHAHVGSCLECWWRNTSKNQIYWKLTVSVVFFYIKLALHVTFGLIVLRNPVSIFWKVDEPKTKYFKWRLHGLHTNTFSQTLSHYNSNLYTWHDKKTDFFLGLIDIKNCLSTTGSFQFDEKTHFQ